MIRFLWRYNKTSRIYYWTRAW